MFITFLLSTLDTEKPFCCCRCCLYHVENVKYALLPKMYRDVRILSRSLPTNQAHVGGTSVITIRAGGPHKTCLMGQTWHLERTRTARCILSEPPNRVNSKDIFDLFLSRIVPLRLKMPLSRLCRCWSKCSFTLVCSVILDIRTLLCLNLTIVWICVCLPEWQCYGTRAGWFWQKM